MIKAGSRYTKVSVLDTPGQGNACHEYSIESVTDQFPPTYINFQNGPVKEANLNGIFIEDLLAIVVHRLEGFQSGTFACRENALALTHVQDALHWLDHRTKDRNERNVEGTNKL